MFTVVDNDLEMRSWSRHRTACAILWPRRSSYPEWRVKSARDLWSQEQVEAFISISEDSYSEMLRITACFVPVYEWKFEQTRQGDD